MGPTGSEEFGFKSVDDGEFLNVLKAREHCSRMVIKEDYLIVLSLGYVERL